MSRDVEIEDEKFNERVACWSTCRLNEWKKNLKTERYASEHEMIFFTKHGGRKTMRASGIMNLTTNGNLLTRTVCFMWKKHVLCPCWNAMNKIFFGLEKINAIFFDEIRWIIRSRCVCRLAVNKRPAQACNGFCVPEKAEQAAPL